MKITLFLIGRMCSDDLKRWKEKWQSKKFSSLKCIVWIMEWRKWRVQSGRKMKKLQVLEGNWLSVSLSFLQFLCLLQNLIWT